MTYERFEDLPVRQKAAELYERTEKLLENHGLKATSGFRDQLDRAALSNNIAEGFERATTNELLQFIYIARGSAGEVRSMLTLKLRRADKVNGPLDLKFQISNLGFTSNREQNGRRGGTIGTVKTFLAFHRLMARAICEPPARAANVEKRGGTNDKPSFVISNLKSEIKA